MDNCICELEPGHGPTDHRCMCGNRWAVGEASPDCSGVLWTSQDSETRASQS